MTQDTTWTNTITAVTLFVEDLEKRKRSTAGYLNSRSFLRGHLRRLQIRFHHDQPAADRSGRRTGDSAQVASGQSGARAVYTLSVDDVDAKCAELQTKGVTLLNGPIDRPWGVRTASFKDPAGNIWEIAK